MPDRIPRHSANSLRTRRINSVWFPLHHRAWIVLFPAIFTDPVNLKSMARGHVMMLMPDLLLQLSDFRRKKFHRTATLGAHHVMMAAPVVLVLEARNAVVKCHRARESAFRQQLQRAIHGRE